MDLVRTKEIIIIKLQVFDFELQITMFYVKVLLFLLRK